MMCCAVCGFPIARNGECLHTALRLSTEAWRRLSQVEREAWLRVAQNRSASTRRIAQGYLQQEERE